MKKCFIICPIGKDTSDERNRSDKLLKHILDPICSKCNFEPIRVDTLNSNGSINETIIDYLNESELVIADLTDHNPNVFYEMGYRTALKKPIIQLKSKADTIPFDVSHVRTFDYDLTDLDSVEEIKSRLIKTINTMTFDTNDSSTVKETGSQNFNSQVLQELFKIQDSIKDLKSDISTKDSSAVSVLADKLVNTGSKTAETTLIETLLPTLLNDPDKLVSLMNYIQKYTDLK